MVTFSLIIYSIIILLDCYVVRESMHMTMCICLHVSINEKRKFRKLACYLQRGRRELTEGPTERSESERQGSVSSRRCNRGGYMESCVLPRPSPSSFFFFWWWWWWWCVGQVWEHYSLACQVVGLLEFENETNKLSSESRVGKQYKTVGSLLCLRVQVVH